MIFWIFRRSKLVASILKVWPSRFRIVLRALWSRWPFVPSKKGWKSPGPCRATFLNGDPTRLRRILINLAGNAIKFTKQGEVSVRAERLRSKDGLIPIRISVSDTGMGIPEEKQLQIFSAFSQADSSTTREFGGTGLGLSISARLIQLMK